MDLYPFQQEMVEHLAKQKSRLCGDDMGLGKTVEGIALDKYNRIHNPPQQGKPKTLIVTPLSVFDTWQSHYAEWSPHLKVMAIDPKKRHDFIEAVLKGSADVYITHWEALRLMPELQKRQWFHIIADECHKAKGRKAQQSRALKKLKTTYKTGLSGTPADNRPQDIWSILNWLYPKVYTSYWRFYNQYIDYEIVYPQGYHKMIGVKNLELLRAEMKPWYIRRRKEEVLDDLPDKYYTDIWVDLTPKQKKAYETMKKSMIAWIGEHEDQPLSSPVVVAQLMRLQQFALAFAEIGPEGKLFMAEPSSKIDALMDILENTDEQVVVFSNFKQAIKLVTARLDKSGRSYCVLTGDTKQDERGPMVSDFQAGRYQVFLGTVAAGGVGITLTAASTIVFMDRAWSPSQNAQAEDRLHRIGQKNAVQVIDIMARNTVDLGRRQLLKQKWSWLKELLGDDVDPDKLTKD